MEENQNKKLTYEELSKNFNNLYSDYQKLSRDYRGAIDALRNIDSTSFFLNAAFQVMAHPELYSDNFVNECSKKIEYIVTRFGANMEPQKEEAGEAE